MSPRDGRRPGRPVLVTGATIWAPGRRAMTAGLLLTVATGAFESLGVNTVLPAVSAELRDVDHYGLVFSAFMLAHLVGIVGGGFLADRSSPGGAFLLGALIFSGGLLVTGTATSMLVVAVGRGLQGLGAGAISGLSIYAVRQCYDEASRPRMLALLSTAFVVPGLLGPSLAAIVSETVGWRWVFLALVPVMPAAAALSVPVLRRTATASTGDDELRRALLPMAVAVTAAFVGLAVDDLAVRLVAAVPAVAFGVVALTRIFPVGTARMASGAPAAVGYILCGAAAYYSIEAFLPLALIEVHGATVVAAGLTLSAGTVLWTAGTWLQARLATRRTGPAVLAVGAPLLLAGVASTGLLMVSPQVSFLIAVPTWAVTTLAMGMTLPSATLIVLQDGPAGSSGRTSSSVQVATLLGGAVGTGLAGTGLSRDAAAGGPDLGSIVLLAVIFAVLAVVAALRTRPALRSGVRTSVPPPDTPDR